MVIIGDIDLLICRVLLLMFKLSWVLFKFEVMVCDSFCEVLFKFWEELFVSGILIVNVIWK